MNTKVRNSVAGKYDTVAKAKAGSFVVGQIVKTKGYTAAGDGGGAKYRVEALGTPDGYGDHATDDGLLMLVLQAGVIDARKFGVFPSPVDSTAALAALAAYINTNGGTVEIPYTDGFYSITQGFPIYRGEWRFASKALIKNIADDGVNFWNNTAAFVGSYFGYNAADGINSETSYDMADGTIGDRSITLSTPAQDSNFTVGDVVYIKDANNYGVTDFAIASHITEVVSISSGVIRLRDVLPMTITSDGGTSPTITIATDSIASTDTGKPATATLAKGVKLVNAQFESVRESWCQAVHISSHECDLHFKTLKGAELLGINPCSYTDIAVDSGLYHKRGFELAYHHSYVNVPTMRLRREKILTPDTDTSVPFAVTEYGNNFSFGVIDTDDEDWTNDTNQAIASFLTPINSGQLLKVNGSQNIGVSFGSGNERAEDTVIDQLFVGHSKNKGVVIDASNVTINHVAVASLPSVSTEIAVEVRTGCTGVQISTGNLGGGPGSGTRYRIEDDNGVATVNKYGAIWNHFTQSPSIERGLIDIIGTGADNIARTHNVPMYTSTKNCEWLIRVSGNIPVGSTTGAKTIELRMNTTTMISIALTNVQTGFVELEARVQKSDSHVEQNVSLKTNSVVGAAFKTTAYSINTTITDLDFDFVLNMNAADTFKLRNFSVEPVFDNVEIT